MNERAASPLRIAVLVGLAALVTALAWSWHPSLWTDEAATISAARRSLPELVAMARNIDAVHATYYAVMHGWLTLFPPSAFWLRVPSALAVALAATGTAWIGHRLAGPRVALTAGLVFALLPRVTWMGIEARPYAFSALLAAAATIALLRLVDARRPRTLGLLAVAYALAVGLGIADHIYVALLLVAHGLSLLATPVPWRRRAAWFGAALVGVALAAPVVWTAVHQTGQLGGGAFGVGTWLRNVIVNQWFLGETPTLAAGSPVAIATGFAVGWKVGAVLLAGISWLLVVVGVVWARRSRPLLVWALPWIVVPTAVIGLYAVGVQNLYSTRYFSYAAPGLALLVGHGLVALADLTRGRRVGRWAAVAAAVAIVVSAAPVYVSQRQELAKSGADWARLAAYVSTQARPGDGVYFAPRYPIVGPTVPQTTRNVSVAYPAPFVGLRDVTLLRTPVQDANLTGTSRVLADAGLELSQVRTVWAIRRVDYDYTVADEQTLAAAGFRPGRVWAGPLDVVTEFTR